MSHSTPISRLPSIASSTAGMPWSRPRAAAPWTPPPSPLGFTRGQKLALWLLRIVAGVALLAVACVLMGFHVSTLLRPGQWWRG
jgi:hypothetical protein